MVAKADCHTDYHNIIDHGSAMLWVDPSCRYELSTGGGVYSSSTADRWQVVVAVWGTDGTVALHTSLGTDLTLEGTSSSSSWSSAHWSIYFHMFNRNSGQRFHGEIAELMLFAREVNSAMVACDCTVAYVDAT